MKKILIVTVLFAVSLWAVNTFMPIHGEEKIYDSVLRLHVIANSDSEADQALKLTVRDAVLAETEGLLDGAVGREEATAILRAQLPYCCFICIHLMKQLDYQVHQRYSNTIIY